MHFNNDLQNHVIDDSGPAKEVLKNSSGAVIIATAKYVKGTVFALAIPGCITSIPMVVCRQVLKMIKP
jgi:hypothetical protein